MPRLCVRCSTTLLSLILVANTVAGAAEIAVGVEKTAAPRVRYGTDRLAAALKAIGYQAVIHDSESAVLGPAILVGTRGQSPAIDRLATSGQLPLTSDSPGREGFLLQDIGSQRLVVAGSDDSGTLFGCLELADRIRAAGKLPEHLQVADAPVFRYRGPCVGLQKTEQLYDNAPYDYPITEELFPFFYDKDHWTRYLDFLAENRMNTLTLWNGHPFASLLKLPEYPDAQEVSEEQLARNIEMFTWLTREADRRGIWVIQFFYNIHLSHKLAKARGVPFQGAGITPLTSGYTRYCIREFVSHYPHVGLMVTLGEAMSEEQGPEWLCGTIIPGVQDAMRELKLAEEPPIIVRAHATKIEEAMRRARTIYQNLYTNDKWSGESLSWTDTRGEERRLHEAQIRLGAGHMINVHLLANLEPFRWGSPAYVQTCMENAQRLGALGLHLYPLRYWEWPITADAVTPPLAQIDRDWIWFATWARYAWNPQRDRQTEYAYWSGRLAERYGSREAGSKILDAYQAAGPCLPMLLGRFGITGGGRQCLSLGMLMTQLVHPDRYSVWRPLHESNAPEGELLEQWVEREWRNQPHQGETPPEVADTVERLAAEAVAAAEAAAPYVTKNREEFQRLSSDLHCTQVLCQCYAAKARAAMRVLRYPYSHDLADLQKAEPLLEEGLRRYEELVALTDQSYREACSLHTPTRKIPFTWSAAEPYRHWRDCLPAYTAEVRHFQENVALLRRDASAQAPRHYRPLPAVRPTVLTAGAEAFEVRPGARLFTDRDGRLATVAEELQGLEGIRFSDQRATSEGMAVEFDLPEPAKILVGFLDGNPATCAKQPDWEWDAVLTDALAMGDLPKVTVCCHAFPAGNNRVDFGKGTYLILGFTKPSEVLEPRVVGATQPDRQEGRKGVDWLFESQTGSLP